MSTTTSEPVGMKNLAKLRNNTASWWFRDPGLRKLSLGICVGYAGTIATGFDNSLVSGLIANPVFLSDLGNIDPNKFGLIFASTLIGMFVGSPVATYTADRWGRRFNIAVGSIVIIAGALIQTFTTGGWKFMAGKIVLGVGNAVVGVATGPYTAEIAHPRNRPQTTALINSFYYVGSIIAAWTTYGVLIGLSGSWTWRLCVLLQAAPSAAMLLAVPFIPESPRFLLAKGREEEAHQMLAKYHANGDAQDELVLYELEEIREALLQERECQQVTYSTFLKTKGNRHRLAIVLFTGFVAQWVGNGIISSYLPLVLETVGIIKPTEQTAFNGGLQIWNWIAATIAGLLCERLGRRFLWLFSVTGMLFSFVVITACSAVYASNGSAGAGRAVLAFLFIYFGFYDAAFSAMTYVYLLEILPYSLRTKGFAIFTMSTCVAAFFNIYVNPIALAAIAWKYYIVFIVINASAIVIIWFYYPETKGRVLEEVAEIFDGATAVLPVQAAFAQTPHLGHSAEALGQEKMNPGAEMKIETKEFA